MKGLVLVGFMGTGKTAVGRTLATRLQSEFVDTDDMIVQRAGKPISDIFAQDGEPHFRQMETEMLAVLAKEPNPQRVMATGGGIVLAEENWPWLRQLGDVVCLTAKPETIRRRVGLAQDRPLLTGRPEEVRKRVESLLAARQSAYARADWTCATDERTLRQVAEQILAWRKKRSAGHGKE